ncbi:hypothetical protein BD408DRAFT_444886 [Parasitella parasitica]|nr:hypothetical protein BD408DRAFT_444886 [Parasitella parasitica]
MSLKELHFPKALNIIRPSSSPLIQRHDSSYSSSTASSCSPPSTVSNSSFTHSPTIVNSSTLNYFQNNWSSFKPTNIVGVNPHRFLQRPRSNSNLSKSTFFSTLSASSQDRNQDDDEDDLNSSIDGLDETDQELEQEEEEEEEEEEPVVKVVAKIKHGTIMNGKGEFVNKGGSITEENAWLDEARANRKIADLEIEKASLLVLNTTLEAKLRQQTAQIVELQKRLQMNEGPLTPVSDKHVEDFLFDDDENTVVHEDQEIEQDQVFQRIKSMLENLILQAEVALLQKTKQSGKVLQDYSYSSVDKQLHVEETLHKLTVKTLPSSIVNMHSNNAHTKRASSPFRRVSDASSVSSKGSASSVKMSRTLSRQSSPPVMVSSSRPFSPPPPPQQQSQKRASSPRHTYHLRKDLEKPKWSF